MHGDMDAHETDALTRTAIAILESVFLRSYCPVRFLTGKPRSKKGSKVMGALKPVSDYEFATVVEESGYKIEFPTPGSSFVGIYKGAEEVKPESAKDESDWFTRLLFEDTDEKTGYINAGAKLMIGFEGIEAGSVVRITYVGDVEMSDPGKNPMKDYRVEVGTAKK
jgi:hypothetical protein